MPLQMSLRHHACLPKPAAARACARPRCSAKPVRAAAGEAVPAGAVGRREQLLLLGGAATAAVVAAGAGAPAPACAAQAQAEACSEFSTAATNGLQWCETLVGDGPAPVAGAMIRCHYTGRLQTNGAVFDSSYERGRPLEFKIGVRQVIVGWDLGILGDEAQGIPAMLEGGKRRLVIPADLAYGKRTMGPIPPDSTLVFDVELLGKRRR